MQQEYVFDEPQAKKAGKLSGVGKFIWNSETKEFCGRDGASWAKVSIFYAVFYAFLGSFFVGLLAIFIKFMPTDKPTYYGVESTMNVRGLNPGLGFRPQIDVEDHLIAFNPLSKSNENNGYEKYVNNLNNYLAAKYQPQEASEVIECADGQTYVDELKKGKSCKFNPSEAFQSTDCTKEKDYGFKTNRPCILVKVNKIIDWTPVSAKGGIEIRCEGETSADKDNLRGVTYHVEGNLNANNYTLISSKYYPFFAQKSYRAPFVWAQFDISPNTLVNIECKAYAENIDNSDRLNRRGQTKFSLFVKQEN